MLAIYAFFLSSLLPSHSARADLQADCRDFWNEIIDANFQFEKKESIRDGQRLLTLLPTSKKHPSAECEAHDEAVDSFYKNHNYRKKLIERGNPLGIQITFRILPLAGGSFAEDLNNDLAELLLNYPTLFLKSLKQEHGDTYCPQEIVKAVGTKKILDHDRRERFQKRIDALKSVKDSDLLDLRDDCVKVLSTITSSSK